MPVGIAFDTSYVALSVKKGIFKSPLHSILHQCFHFFVLCTLYSFIKTHSRCVFILATSMHSILLCSLIQMYFCHNAIFSTSNLMLFLPLNLNAVFIFLLCFDFYSFSKFPSSTMSPSRNIFKPFVLSSSTYNNCFFLLKVLSSD